MMSSLVKAGVITALCKCALHLSATIMHDGDDDPSSEDKEEITKALDVCPIPRPLGDPLQCVRELCYSSNGNGEEYG